MNFRQEIKPLYHHSAKRPTHPLRANSALPSRSEPFQSKTSKLVYQLQVSRSQGAQPRRNVSIFSLVVPSNSTSHNPISVPTDRLIPFQSTAVGRSVTPHTRVRLHYVFPVALIQVKGPSQGVVTALEVRTVGRVCPLQYLTIAFRLLVTGQLGSRPRIVEFRCDIPTRRVRIPPPLVSGSLHSQQSEVSLRLQLSSSAHYRYDGDRRQGPASTRFRRLRVLRVKQGKYGLQGLIGNRPRNDS